MHFELARTDLSSGFYSKNQSADGKFYFKSVALNLECSPNARKLF